MYVTSVQARVFLVVVLTACQDDAPRPPPPSQEVAPLPPPPPTIDAVERVLSSLTCDAIFPQAERDKLVPKAYERPGGGPGGCRFELVVSKIGTTRFDIEVDCTRESDDDAAIDEEMKRRATNSPDAVVVVVPKVGKRAYRGEDGSYRWARAWDDDSPCVVEVGNLPGPFDIIGVLTKVLSHITET